jgi:hypothetical protein
MTRESFLALAGALYDAHMAGGAAQPSSGTGGGNAPKYDTTISRKNGMVQYASECSVRELTYWKQNAERPPSDPKYADANAKQAKALGYWIAWREQNPSATWAGERNKVTVTAASPSDKPALYPRGERAGEPKTETPPLDGGGFDDDDIPF